MSCYRHTYRLVNNRYNEKGEHVIEGGEWRTEQKCGVLLADKIKEYDKQRDRD